RNLPGTEDAAVISRRSHLGTELAAFVVQRAGGAVTITQIREALRAVLPPVMMPVRIRLVASIPHLPSGKLDASALAALDGADDAHPRPQAATVLAVTPGVIPQAVHRSWSAVL